MRKRILSIITVLAMCFSMLPTWALAAEPQEDTNLCAHHPEHTAECGYTEGAEGTPCGHEHTEDCYTLVTECVHDHTDECYPQESVSGNVATPPDAEQAKPTVCAHVCSEESDCIVKELDCQHEHTDCGYTETVLGTSCTFCARNVMPKAASRKISASATRPAPRKRSTPIARFAARTALI